MEDLDTVRQLYVPHVWTHYTFDPYDEDASRPVGKQNRMTQASCHSESNRYYDLWTSVERAPIEKRQEIVNQSFVWDLELTAAGFPELGSSGGSVTELAQDWNGHAAGSVLMEAYRVVPFTDGKEHTIPHKVLFETFLAEPRS